MTKPASNPSPLVAARPAERGFTLIELLTSTALAVFLIIIILDIFETSARINRAQSDVADMQQAQRIVQSEVVRMAQMTGRGGLPAGNMPLGVALSVLNNVPDPTYINPGDDQTPQVSPGTDVLTVRGVFHSPIYQINYGAKGETSDFTLNDPTPANATGGTIIIRNPGNASIPQDVSPLVTAINQRIPEALIIVNPQTDLTYAIVELDPNNSTINGDGSVTVGFLISGGTYTNQYLPLSTGGGYPSQMNNAAFMGILEEYRYYVKAQSIAGEFMPVLSRARAFPGTTAPYGGTAANWGIDLADNTYDQQVALGIDVDGDFLVADGGLLGTPKDTDEFLYNDADDDATAAGWGAGTINYLRITTLVRGDRPDPRYEAPIINSIEDHDLGSSTLNTEDQRRYRRRVVTTTIDLRNL